jgi:ribosomal protein L11 methyltransferase
VNAEIFKCTVGTFSIGDSFEAVDLLFEKGYMAVSCIEKNEKWFVEVLSDKPILKSDILKTLHSYPCSEIEIEKLKNINWLKKCFENFRPIIVGNFYVYGPHLRDQPMPKNKVGIEIAAATAFGTGEHPTTNRCLLACQTFFDSKNHETVLDIGCGSCILSIALAKLGARDVTSCDIDPEAIKVSLENIVLNKVAHRIHVFQNKEHEFSFRQYDFIVANILAEPLIAISTSVIKSLKKDGILILSGFNSNDHSIVEKYTYLGLRARYIYDHENWSTIVFQK